MIFGFISGLLPGLHSNTIISILSSLGIDKNALALIIISLYPVHLIVSFIPSIFFGIPDSTTIVSVLPGQRMVLNGEGIQALKAIIFSCIIAALISVALFYFSLDFIVILYEIIRPYMKYILLLISSMLVLKSKTPHLAILIFLLAGALGYFSLNSKIYDPFLPLFSGMFAIAAIIAYKGSKVPEQQEKAIGFGFVKFSILGILLGFFADLIPGVGSPSQVAAFASIFTRLDTVGYLAIVSAISVSEAIFSLATSASIGKSRIGATAWLAQTIDIQENLLFLLSIFILSMAIAVITIYSLRKYIAKLASLDFTKLNFILLVYLASITFILDGLIGIIILIFGGLIGLLTLKLGVERINLMGAIIVPTLLLLFRISI